MEVEVDDLASFINNEMGMAGGGGDAGSSHWRKEKFAKMDDDDDEVEDVTPKVSPTRPMGSGGGDDDDVLILDSDSPNSSSVRVKNPLHNSNKSKKNSGKKQPECIDLTTEDEDGTGDVDADMVSVVDDSEIIFDEDPEGIKTVNLADDEDEDLPVLMEIPPVSKTEMAEKHKKTGNEHFAKGEYNTALESYTRAIKLLPAEPAFYGNRSACYMMMKRYNDALADSLKAVQLDAGFEKGYLRLVRAYLALGDIPSCESAVADYEARGFKGDISNEKRKLQELKRLKNDLDGSTLRKDFRRAVFVCDRLLEIATGDLNIKIRKGNALLKLGRHSEAGEIASEIMTADSHNVEAHTMRGLCNYQLDNMDKALLLFKAALQLSPDAIEPKICYKQIKQLKENRENATNLFKQGRYDESKVLYLKCVETVISDGDLRNSCLESKFYFNLSLILNKQRIYDEAIDYASKAIDLNSSYYKALVHRATVYNAKEMYEEAGRDFEAAYKLDPTKRELRSEIQNTKLAAKRAKRKDYYKILDVSKSATDDEIRKAYKKRALMHHPDRHASATEAVQKEQEKHFKDVGEAYEVLSDPKKRFRYDQGHDLMESPTGGGGGFYEPYDPNHLFNMFFSASGGGMGMGGHGHPGRPSPGASRYYSSTGRGAGPGCSFSGGGFR